MTPEQIIDAMGRCIVDPEGEHRCDGCAYAEPNTYCLNRLKHDAYELMKRQKEELRRIKNVLHNYREIGSEKQKVMAVTMLTALEAFERWEQDDT